MKIIPILLASIIAGCATPSKKYEWVDLKGNIPEQVSLQAALEDCGFERKAKLVRSLRDMAFRENSQIQQQTMYSMKNTKPIEENRYYEEATRIANEINQCMFEHSIVSIKH